MQHEVFIDPGSLHKISVGEIPRRFAMRKIYLWRRLFCRTGTAGNYHLYPTRHCCGRPHAYRASTRNNESDLGLKIRLVRVQSQRDSVITGFCTRTVTIAICTAISRQFDEEHTYCSCDAVTQLGAEKRHVFNLARNSKQRAPDGTYVYLDGGSRW